MGLNFYKNREEKNKPEIKELQQTQFLEILNAKEVITEEHSRNKSEKKTLVLLYSNRIFSSVKPNSLRKLKSGDRQQYLDDLEYYGMNFVSSFIK
ncbi:hypothetical protein BpHYR1_028167 [Brachionus plicatilis]|uniref:Uncharacterized protein n=1 Tax=Brachionus plicatilis TaxID=10195 RepID=A0A3M7Q7P6_BRAPC|nr:hypothetical protein BpHYR1_028167 [Brachionus plicatilis]